MTSTIKILSKDGKILKIAQSVINEMVTFLTMLDCPGFEDNDDEPIPIIEVNGESIILRTLTSLLTKFGVFRQHCIVESVVLKEGGKQIYLN